MEVVGLGPRGWWPQPVALTSFLDAKFGIPLFGLLGGSLRFRIFGPGLRLLGSGAERDS